MCSGQIGRSCNVTGTQKDLGLRGRLIKHVGVKSLEHGLRMQREKRRGRHSRTEYGGRRPLFILENRRSFGMTRTLERNLENILKMGKTSWGRGAAAAAILPRGAAPAASSPQRFPPAEERFSAFLLWNYGRSILPISLKRYT